MRHPIVKQVNDTFVEGFNRFRPPRSIGMRLIGDCMLRTIRDLKVTEEDFQAPDAAGMHNMSYGSVHEIWILERLKDAKLLKYGGVMWKDMQVNVRAHGGNGYMDALVHYKGQDIAVEVKTKGSRDFDAIVSGKKPPDKMHVYQLMTYMHFLKIKQGWLLYLDREKHYEARNGEIIPRWEILEIPYNPKLGQTLENRLIKLSKHRAEGTLPKKEPKSSDDPRCRFCSYKKDCWGQPTTKPARRSTTADRVAKASNARRRARPLLGNTPVSGSDRKKTS